MDSGNSIMYSACFHIRLINCIMDFEMDAGMLNLDAGIGMLLILACACGCASSGNSYLDTWLHACVCE